MRKLNKKFSAADLQTLKLIQEMWEDIEKGRYRCLKVKEFFKEISKW